MNFFTYILLAIVLCAVSWAYTILWLISPKVQRAAEASRRRLLRILGLRQFRTPPTPDQHNLGTYKNSPKGGIGLGSLLALNRTLR